MSVFCYVLMSFARICNLLGRSKSLVNLVHKKNTFGTIWHISLRYLVHLIVSGITAATSWAVGSCQTMAESWKQRLTSASDKIFPGLTYYNSYGETEFIKLGNEIVSNLPLQMSLYFNVIFFPFWLCTVITMLQLKYECLSNIYRFIVVTILIAVIGIECLRLYMGYLGNLTEKIPELAGFWMLSLLLQFPLQMFLFVNEETIPSPIERAVQGIMLSFLIVQLISGFFALRHASQHQAKRFHIMQFQTPPGSRSELNLVTKID
ncbi:transmembrane protein 17B-like [Periplaneta americana]|uniref:transmembrane protein 17B-like n=1 Tax=Periplaneta americana TaxID=6978 RepID=UPI0037E7C9FE